MRLSIQEKLLLLRKASQAHMRMNLLRGVRYDEINSVYIMFRKSFLEEIPPEGQLWMPVRSKSLMLSEDIVIAENPKYDLAFDGLFPEFHKPGLHGLVLMWNGPLLIHDTFTIEVRPSNVLLH